ncbi:helix-turn-helix domain-containing protein [Arthrobacter sp. ZGTC412]|uniref:helix-turn-helix domain-containing protein n=1 Tax=Arthrobacter sp. ZGTC412 TaxID=2058900 RepID=UPI000CE43270|nr:helix-turn-helix domain-containing protein [Arthrobacter sp. ZGTC412]
MSIANVPSHYLTIAEVATVLRVSKMTVYRLVQAQALASARFGNSYRIPEDAVEEYVRKAAAPAVS